MGYTVHAAYIYSALSTWLLDNCTNRSNFVIL